MIRNPAGQTLRGLPQQGGAGASKNQESSRVPGPIHQHAQNGKQLLAALDFVDDDQAAQGFESELGVGKLSLVGGILKIEDGNRTTGILDEKAGQRGLSHLARAHDRHHGKVIEQGPQGGFVPGSINHSCHDT